MANLASGVFATLRTANFIANTPSLPITDAGQTIDLSGLLESSSKSTRAINIINLGANPVRIGFNKNGSDITYDNDPKLGTTENGTANNPSSSWDYHLAPSGSPGDSISAPLEAATIGLRAASGNPSTVMVTVA